MPSGQPNPRFFRSPNELRSWFEKHHATSRQLWVGYYKRHSGKPSVTWPQSVDEALRVGWIDGVRKSLDDLRYVIRFSPRRARSVWSAVNIRRVRELTAQGLMLPAGLEAFAARKENRSGIYSYEQRPADLIEPYASLLKKNKAAWKFFQAQAPSYRKTANWWVISARKEETRLRRLQQLIQDSAKGRRLPPLLPPKSAPSEP